MTINTGLWCAQVSFLYPQLTRVCTVTMTTKLLVVLLVLCVMSGTVIENVQGIFFNIFFLFRVTINTITDAFSTLMLVLMKLLEWLKLLSSQKHFLFAKKNICNILWCNGVERCRYTLM
jgi:hypothetical protein